MADPAIPDRLATAIGRRAHLGADRRHL